MFWGSKKIYAAERAVLKIEVQAVLTESQRWEYQGSKFGSKVLDQVFQTSY